jgi:hypothetical protein
MGEPVSRWHTATEDDITLNQDTLDVYAGYDYYGNIYVEIPLELLRKYVK